MEIKLNKGNRDSYPNSKSGKEFLIKWLKKHPIQDQEEALQLQKGVEQLKIKVANACRAPLQRKPRRRRLKPEGSKLHGSAGEAEVEAEASGNKNMETRKENDLATNGDSDNHSTDAISSVQRNHDVGGNQVVVDVNVDGVVQEDNLDSSMTPLEDLDVKVRAPEVEQDTRTRESSVKDIPLSVPGHPHMDSVASTASTKKGTDELRQLVQTVCAAAALDQENRAKLQRALEILNEGDAVTNQAIAESAAPHREMDGSVGLQSQRTQNSALNSISLGEVPFEDGYSPMRPLADKEIEQLLQDGMSSDMDCCVTETEASDQKEMSEANSSSVDTVTTVGYVVPTSCTADSSTQRDPHDIACNGKNQELGVDRLGIDVTLGSSTSPHKATDENEKTDALKVQGTQGDLSDDIDTSELAYQRGPTDSDLEPRGRKVYTAQRSAGLQDVTLLSAPKMNDSSTTQPGSVDDMERKLQLVDERAIVATLLIKRLKGHPIEDRVLQRTVATVNEWVASTQVYRQKKPPPGQHRTDGTTRAMGVSAIPKKMEARDLVAAARRMRDSFCPSNAVVSSVKQSSCVGSKESTSKPPADFQEDSLASVSHHKMFASKIQLGKRPQPSPFSGIPTSAPKEDDLEDLVRDMCAITAPVGAPQESTGFLSYVKMDETPIEPVGVDDEGHPGKRQALNDHTIMARALGLQGCDFQDWPFNQHQRMCWPSRAELYKEFERRCALGIKCKNGN